MGDRILLLENKPILRMTLANDLTKGGYEVTVASDREGALRLMQEKKFDVALLDLDLFKAGCLTVFKSFKATTPQGLAIMMTANRSINSASTMKTSGADYVVQSFPTDDFLIHLRKLLAQHAGPPIRQIVSGEVQQLDEIIFASERMARVCDLIETAAASDATILIQGETGTGKELVARALHKASHRRGEAFIAVSCASLPESLVESELFGHEKGAFTGAFRERKGRFELARKGTLFLDEVADLGPAVQAKLLRVIQEKEFERVGGTQTVKADVRLISATRKRMEDELLAGRLREDLYYRLKVITISLPPLRERNEDILPLAQHFLKQFRQPLGKKIGGLSSEACRLLLAHDWPGNVRELEGSMQRAVTLTKNETLRPEDFSLGQLSITSDRRGQTALPLNNQKNGTVRLNGTINEAERLYVNQVLRAVGGQRKRAAEILGISRKTLWKKMKLFGGPQCQPSAHADAS